MLTFIQFQSFLPIFLITTITTQTTRKSLLKTLSDSLSFKPTTTLCCLVTSKVVLASIDTSYQKTVQLEYRNGKKSPLPFVRGTTAYEINVQYRKIYIPNGDRARQMNEVSFKHVTPLFSCPLIIYELDQHEGLNSQIIHAARA